MAETIQVRVRAFAAVREALGFGDRMVDLPRGSDVGALLGRLAAEHPGAGLGERRLAIAVNRAYVGAEVLLSDGDEVALIPPVSGGSGASGGPRRPERKLYEVTTGPLSLDDVARRVVAPDRGGIALFAGTVRGVTGDVATDYLEYEAYPEMAEAALAQIAAEVQAKWPAVTAVSIVHRIGRLEVGDMAVVIAVAAGHRQDTFDACHYAIDRVKQIAPIWKREVGTNGAVWVEGPESNLTGQN